MNQRNKQQKFKHHTEQGSDAQENKPHKSSGLNQNSQTVNRISLERVKDPIPVPRVIDAEVNGGKVDHQEIPKVVQVGPLKEVDVPLIVHDHTTTQDTLEKDKDNIQHKMQQENESNKKREMQQVEKNVDIRKQHPHVRMSTDLIDTRNEVTATNERIFDWVRRRFATQKELLNVTLNNSCREIP